MYIRDRTPVSEVNSLLTKCVACSSGIIFFFSSRRRHTRQESVSWARRCVQETAFFCVSYKTGNKSSQEIEKTKKCTIKTLVVSKVFAGYTQQCILCETLSARGLKSFVQSR
eukprot:TRINITY_DN4127_c0_g1_i4.p2 TRINITY_DN4127_c0_g1~~TRINITY_DN4127_c0_g1_i4.p2  ORF type:complete len:112 (+),score=18.46 TRINITY_DN4127_c0_g1_i4:3-338(+)